MLKLLTPVTPDPASVSLSYNDRILVLGSCFADEIGARLSQAGFQVLCNPFGTLYNPVSLCNAVARLESGVPFTDQDVVEMGAQAGRVCSFWHHTSFSRETAGEFLEHANAALAEASAFWKSCNRVIITLGTSSSGIRTSSSSSPSVPSGTWPTALMGINYPRARYFSLPRIFPTSLPTKS